MKSWIQLAQQQSKIFELAVPLTIGETYTISMNSNEPFMISVGDVFVGETVGGSLEFVATNSGDVMITSYSDISMEFEIKLELGSQTEWSPAPEDGYANGVTPYHGVDAGYHIQSQDGFDSTKYYYPGSVISGDLGMGVNVKNFGSHNIYVQSTSKSVTVQPNQHVNTEQRFSNATYPVNYSFDTQVSSRDLDIVASGPYLWVNPSLIKGDFSDFTPYQGATVTRNKTFPIDVFKGGRNLLLDSGETTIINAATMAYRDIGTPIELQPNVDYVFSWNIDWLEETTLPLLMGIGLSRTGVAYHWDFPAMGGIVVNKNETQFRTIRITQSQYDDGLKYFAYRLRNRNQLMTIELNTRKFEKGSTPTEYSPAPEDGYDYTGDDGAYHIQTTGGGHTLKYFVNTPALDLGTEVVTTGRYHSFNNNLLLWQNRTDIKPFLIPNGETYEYVRKGLMTSVVGAAGVQYQFRTGDVNQSLDFIASDPIILEEEGTYGIANIGNIEATPVLRLIYISGPSSKEFKIGDNYLTYDFPAGEKYVDYDTRTGFPEYEGSRRDRHLSLETETFTIPTGTTLVQYEEGSEIEVSRESRWR